MTKKIIRNFGRENGNFFRKNLIQKILVRENFSRPPKLGARSPPLSTSCLKLIFFIVVGLEAPLSSFLEGALHVYKFSK